MDQAAAITLLKTACKPADESDVALTGEWSAAKAKLGSPIPNAGHPNILPMPPPHQTYLLNLVQQPWAAPSFQGPLRGVSFELVEIDPLLAYQFTVNTDRSSHHCGQLSEPPTIDELLAICLPATAQGETIQVFPGQNSMILKSPSLNIQSNQGGMFNGQILGVQFGATVPFLHVVRLNGRCYLHNGYHRA